MWLRLYIIEIHKSSSVTFEVHINSFINYSSPVQKGFLHKFTKCSWHHSKKYTQTFYLCKVLPFFNLILGFYSKRNPNRIITRTLKYKMFNCFKGSCITKSTKSIFSWLGNLNNRSKK